MTRWNVAAFWQSVHDENEGPQLMKSETATPWIVWRCEHAVYFRPLANDESWALAAVMTGAAFAGLCEGLCD